MSRYIDADALIADFKGQFEDELNETVAVEITKEQPTVDVVKVVRCKDCVHYWKNQKDEDYSDDVAVCLASPKDDAFCSEGERGKS